MIVHTENPREFNAKQLELTNKFSMTAGYNINIKILYSHLLAMNNLKMKLRKQVHLQ